MFPGEDGYGRVRRQPAQKAKAQPSEPVASPGELYLPHIDESSRGPATRIAKAVAGDRPARTYQDCVDTYAKHCDRYTGRDRPEVSLR